MENSVFVEQVRERLAKVEAQLAELVFLQQERERLSGLLSFYEGGEPVKSPSVSHTSLVNTGLLSGPVKGRRNTDIIVELVAERPGVEVEDLKTLAITRISTASREPRKLVGAVISDLLQKNRVRREGGRLYPPAP